MLLVFSSLLFVFLYLPIVLLIYYLTPRKLRSAFLLFVNLIFYGWGEPVFIIVMLASIFTNYIFGFLIEKYRSNKRLAKLFLVLSIIISLGLLGFFKYTGFIVGILKTIPFFSNISVPLIPLPIGISFFTFQAMSYTIDVYRNDVPAQKSAVLFGTYVSLFPQLIAGPIVRYKDVAEQLEDRRENVKQFAEGIRLFVIGLAKKVLLANQMGLIWNELQKTSAQNGILGAWLGIIAFSMQIYFDFGGYSDMARGLGKMIGFEFVKNFEYPYVAKSITDFWRRWHISLSTWFRDYLYIPLGGNRCGQGRTVLNLFIVWFLTGLWHGANFNFILWGVYYFALLTLEKLFLLKYLERVPNFLSHAYALFFILIGWAIFSLEDFSSLSVYLSSMFSVGKGLISPHAGTLLLSYAPLLIAGVLACLPVWKKLYFKVKEQRFFWVFETIAYAVIMILCTASLVNQSYNPFLYFRF